MENIGALLGYILIILFLIAITFSLISWIYMDINEEKRKRVMAIIIGTVHSILAIALALFFLSGSIGLLIMGFQHLWDLF